MSHLQIALIGNSQVDAPTSTDGIGDHATFDQPALPAPSGDIRRLNSILAWLGQYQPDASVTIYGNPTQVEDKWLNKSNWSIANIATLVHHLHRYDLIFITTVETVHINADWWTSYKFARQQRVVQITKDKPKDSNILHIPILPVADPDKIDSALWPELRWILRTPRQWQTRIPRKLHLMWLSRDTHVPIDTIESISTDPIQLVPVEYRANVARFIHVNPEWSVTIWTNNTVDQLMEEHFPNYWKWYSKIERIITRCDFARWCILYVHGGLYCDLDFYNAAPLDGLIQDKEVLLFPDIRENQPSSKKRTYMCNGVVGFCPNSSFIEGWLKQMETNIASIPAYSSLQSRREYDFQSVMRSTGPTALMDYFNSLDVKPLMSRPTLVCPYTHQRKASASLRPYDTIYLYTLWDEGTEWGTVATTTNKWPPYLIALAVFLGIAAILIVFFTIRYLRRKRIT